MEKKTIAEVTENKDFGKKSVSSSNLRPYAIFSSNLDLASHLTLVRLSKYLGYNTEALRSKANQIEKIKYAFPMLTDRQIAQKVFEGSKYRKPRKKMGKFGNKKNT